MIAAIMLDEASATGETWNPQWQPHYSKRAQGDFCRSRSCGYRHKTNGRSKNEVLDLQPALLGIAVSSRIDQG